jgi:polar amino acid transport system substrate-binding protein
MTNRRQVLGLAAALGISPIAQAQMPRELKVVTSHLPPLVLENGTRPGALLELVKLLCERLRLMPEIDFVPWQRAIFVASKMPATAIFPLTRNPQREEQFRWLAPLYEEHYVFLARHGSSFDLKRPAEMLGKRIALLRGAGQASIMREMGYSNLVESASIDEVHRFLLGGMADAAFGERNIIRASLRSRGEVKDFEQSAPVRTTTAWLAGSLDFSEKDAARYQRAMARMQADGSVQRILKRYGLDEEA